MLSALYYKRLQSFFRRQLGDFIPESGGKKFKGGGADAA